MGIRFTQNGHEMDKSNLLISISREPSRAGLTALLIIPFLIAAHTALAASSDTSAHQGQSLPPEQEVEGVLLFRSGFEPESRITHLGDPFTASDKIIGRDLSVPPPNDWVQDIDNSNQLGNFRVQYQGADTTRRLARIIPEPGNPDNRVLLFRINEPWVNQFGSHLARVQANIYDTWPDSHMEGIRELYQKVRLYMHEDMEILKSYPHSIDWLTIFELWNNQTWDNVPYAFRITVGTGKPLPESRELYFMIEAEDYDTERGRMKIWNEMETGIPVPIGRWMTLEFYVREGNDETGRFYMAMTPEGGDKKVIFDVRNYTHNTEDPDPTGIKFWNPMKLYTSSHLTSFVRDHGKSLQVYWDDLEIWKDRRPVEEEPAAASEDEIAATEEDAVEMIAQDIPAGLAPGHYIQLLSSRSEETARQKGQELSGMLECRDGMDGVQIILASRKDNAIFEVLIGVFQDYQSSVSSLGLMEGVIPDDSFVIRFPRPESLVDDYDDIMVIDILHDTSRGLTPCPNRH